MNAGTAVRHIGTPFFERTGMVVEPHANDFAWPDYVRVQLDPAPQCSVGPRLLLEVRLLERVQRAGQLGLFGGAP
ncbi:MAG: hypothetical protein JNM17_04030 [Archangium sp.]|nr:hypothetical protein [Archangium sp.]